MSHDSEASTKFAHKSLIVAAVGKQYCGREDRHAGLAPTRIGAENRNNGPRAAEGAELRTTRGSSARSFPKAELWENDANGWHVKPA